MIANKRFGIALSGGGYRAAGYHIGTLKKLHELGALKKADVLSTISGGSITGAAYCLHEGDFASFEEKMIHAITTKSVIGFVLKSWLFWRGALPLLALLIAAVALPFTKWSRFAILPLFIFIFLVIRFQFKFLPLSTIIEKAYNRFFCLESTMGDLCDSPELAIGSTNLQTMRHFTFSKRKMEDSAYAYYPKPVYFDGAKFPVARAVMASSCVPFAFTPVSIDKGYFKNQDLFDTVDPKLVDGGVYDNQGVHKITQANSSYGCDIIIVSDAGNKMPFEKLYNNTLTLLLRTVDTFMMRIKNFQMIQNIYQNQHGREIAYQSLGWDIDGCVSGFYTSLLNRNISAELISAHRLEPIWVADPKQFKKEITDRLSENCQLAQISLRTLPPERQKAIRNIGTNLTRIKPALVNDMITHAANLTEIQVRLYCPSLITTL